MPQPPTTATTPSPNSPALPNRQEATSLPSVTQNTQKAGILDALRTIQLHDFTTFYQKPCARESLLTGIGAGFAIGGVRFIIVPSGSSSRGNNTSSASSNGRQVWRSNNSSTTSSSKTPGSAPSPSPSPSLSRHPIPPRSANPSATVTLGARAWRSMTWAVLSFTLFSAGAHIFCQRRRGLEQAAMARVNEIMVRKREEKREEALRRRQDREEKRKEHELEKARRSRWGFWFGGSSAASADTAGNDAGPGTGSGRDGGGRGTTGGTGR